MTELTPKPYIEIIPNDLEAFIEACADFITAKHLEESTTEFLSGIKEAILDLKVLSPEEKTVAIRCVDGIVPDTLEEKITLERAFNKIGRAIMFLTSHNSAQDAL